MAFNSSLCTFIMRCEAAHGKAYCVSVSERLRLAIRPVASKLFGSVEKARLREELERARRRLEREDRKLEKMGEELERAREGSPAQRTAPVFFVVGRAKSGTNWLRRLLDLHRELLCRGEGRFFGRGLRQDYAKETALELPPTYLQNAILTAEDLRWWMEKSVWARDDADEHLDNLTRLAVEYFLTRRLEETQKKMVGDNTPLVGPDIVKEIGTVCPEAKVIHIHKGWQGLSGLVYAPPVAPHQGPRRDA